MQSIYFDTSVYNYLLDEKQTLISIIDNAVKKKKIRVIFSGIILVEFCLNQNTNKGVELLKLSKRLCDKKRIFKNLHELIAQEVKACLNDLNPPKPYYLHSYYDLFKNSWNNLCDSSYLCRLPSVYKNQINESKKDDLKYDRQMYKELKKILKIPHEVTYEKAWNTVLSNNGIKGLLDGIFKIEFERILHQEEYDKIIKKINNLKTLYAYLRHGCASLYLIDRANKKPKWGDSFDIHHSSIAIHSDLFISEDEDLVKIHRMIRRSQKSATGLLEFLKSSGNFGKINF